jgi:Raf kinase inhibitor-like YbhB/YbcL family protein
MHRLPAALALLAASSLPAVAGGFTLSSPQVKEGQPLAMEQVFNRFGCSGGNVSPELKWAGAPEGTKSFALTVYDPDAPTGSGWWHWVAFNLPAATAGLPQGAGNPQADLVPAGAVQSRTDFNAPGYGGPCPPPGDKPHRYRFVIHALKVDKLPLGADVPAAMVGFYIGRNELARAELTGTYGR